MRKYIGMAALLAALGGYYGPKVVKHVAKQVIASHQQLNVLEESS